ncbi:cyclase family protein [Aggregatimonas sangjinii]|uniref:Cyclase family protein n=2 Tax=Aggregatimonas sangjinii TaxID=2583587 RepID=A0A5B7SYZ0_9FLAO|nr:cyclase family protein [Aggregatimonas sangjinii]
MKGVAIETAKTLAEDGWNATTLHIYSHVGTHMDAPVHFEVTDQTIDQIPVERFVTEAWVLNLTHIQPSALITVADMDPITNKIGKGQSLILHTGWSKKLYTDAYRNKLPRVSKELAKWIGEKGIGLLGVEPPSVADVNNIKEVTEIHTILMKNDIIIVEGLTNLDQLTKEKVTLVALPLKVENGDGAPARVIAME